MNRACQLLALCGVLLLVVGCAGSPSGRHVDSQKAAEANANLGLDYLGKNQYEQAMHRFQRALQYDHDNRNANWGMALAYQRLDQPEKARSYYQRVLKQEPRPAMLNSYAVFLCQQHEIDQALAYFKRAADDRRNANPASALANAGLCLEQDKRHAEARDYYRKALSIDDSQPTALSRMAQLQYDRGQYLSARAFIERADEVVELSPELLLLAARIENRLRDTEMARRYLQRHNRSAPSKALTFDEL
ncbi:MAG TPA: type IV pilus biogenesis/stability protein PilW [Salinisphaeraceae bacterium]|nr:type IV pilus biogenesis/stability protein PilW [Salinisphaeraceae bacterium]